MSLFEGYCEMVTLNVVSLTCDNQSTIQYSVLISLGVTVVANTMVIDVLQKERDDGMYQCGATNLYGTTFSSAQIRVLSELL